MPERAVDIDNRSSQPLNVRSKQAARRPACFVLCPARSDKDAWSSKRPLFAVRARSSLRSTASEAKKAMSLAEKYLGIIRSPGHKAPHNSASHANRSPTRRNESTLNELRRARAKAGSPNGHASKTPGSHNLSRARHAHEAAPRVVSGRGAAHAVALVKS